MAAISEDTNNLALEPSPAERWAMVSLCELALKEEKTQTGCVMDEKICGLSF